MAEAAAAAEGESVCQCNVRINRIIKLVTNSVSVSEMLRVVLVSFLQIAKEFLEMN